MFVVADADSDGLPDAWEQTHFGNLTQTASADPDADGLTNQQEFQAGSMPGIAEIAVRIMIPRSLSNLP